MSLSSCDKQPGLLEVEEALAQIDAAISKVQGHERVNLQSALDRVLAQDISAPFDVPPHRNSAMDGYALELDFILISPVQKTNTHPDSSPLGWDYFTELTRLAQMPVYALGGLGVEDIPRARSLGAQGVAGIRGFWS
jgi:hypothetical protein